VIANNHWRLKAGTSQVCTGLRETEAQTLWLKQDRCNNIIYNKLASSNLVWNGLSEVLGKPKRTLEEKGQVGYYPSEDFVKM